MQKSARLRRELENIAKNPPPGVSCVPKEDSLDVLEADIIGMKETPYEDGVFKLEIQIPDKYPFEPPILRFITPVYHPNVDAAGRICLDLLRLPPKGTWRPLVSLGGLLTSVQMLLANPNCDDPLMTEIASMAFVHCISFYGFQSRPRHGSEVLPTPEAIETYTRADEYRFNNSEYVRKAKEWTRKHAWQVLTETEKPF